MILTAAQLIDDKRPCPVLTRLLLWPTPALTATPSSYPVNGALLPPLISPTWTLELFPPPAHHIVRPDAITKRIIGAGTVIRYATVSSQNLLHNTRAAIIRIPRFPQYWRSISMIALSLSLSAQAIFCTWMSVDCSGFMSRSDEFWLIWVNCASLYFGYFLYFWLRLSATVSGLSPYGIPYHHPQHVGWISAQRLIVSDPA